MEGVARLKYICLAMVSISYLKFPMVLSISVSLSLESEVSSTVRPFRKEEFKLIRSCGSQLGGRPFASKEHVCDRGLMQVNEVTTQIKAGGLY